MTTDELRFTQIRNREVSEGSPPTSLLHPNICVCEATVSAKQSVFIRGYSSSSLFRPKSVFAKQLCRAQRLCDPCFLLFFIRVSYKQNLCASVSAKQSVFIRDFSLAFIRGSSLI